LPVWLEPLLVWRRLLLERPVFSLLVFSQQQVLLLAWLPV
jgi:hypothetical protein